MRALRFPDEEAVRIAITSGLVPAAVASAPARGRRGSDRAIWIAPLPSLDEALDGAARARLAAAGIEAGTMAVEEAAPASCWAELLAPRRGGEPALDGPLIFLLSDGAALIELAAELLRLGCDRQSFRMLDGATLLRASAAPYYTVTRALDRVAGLRAYAPRGAGEERVWIEVGFEHPLASLLRAPAGQLLLVDGDGRFRRLPDGAWDDVHRLVELGAPPPDERHYAPAPPPGRLRVPLRLARGARPEPPSLWVLRQGAIAQVDALVQSLPDDEVARLLFAATAPVDGEEPLVVLRARRPRDPPALSLGESYAPLLQLANLFVPEGSIVEPPLRRDTLRELIAPQPEIVTWLAPTGGGGAFRIERIAEAAFSPLAEWVEYLLHGAAKDIEPWTRAAIFELEEFESIGVEWSEPRRPPATPAEPAEEPAEPKRKRRAGRKDPVAAPVAFVEEPARPRGSSAALSPLRVELRGGPLEAELQEAERAFVELAAPADAPERRALWLRIAELGTRLGHRRDAGLAWTRALWDLPDGDESAALAARWAEAELRATADGEAALLALTAPTREETRAVVALLVARAAGATSLARAPLPELQRFLDRHDDNLDLRSLWLGRLALSRLSGGDPLGLARARDRVLARLHRGLSVERDLPTFLRFASGGAPGSAPRWAHLAAHLEALLDRFEKTRRARSPVEAKLELTRGYVHFVFALGFARLGDAERAASLHASGARLLGEVAADPVHHFLARAFGARVAQALEGLPPETPLPPDVAGALDELEKFLRYKVDRLREASKILEPQERIHTFAGFLGGLADPRGEEFAGLRGLTDLGQLQRAVEALLGKATAAATPPDERARLFDGMMDFFPTLAESQAVPYLEILLRSLDEIAPLRQAQLLEEALTLAGHFGRGELARTILARLQSLVGPLGVEHAADAARLLGGCLRTLRRVGLRSEAAALLEASAALATGKGVPLLLARVHLAAGFAYLGDLSRAAPAFDEAQALLATVPARKSAPGDLLLAERLELSRALASGLAQTPQDYALDGLAKLSEQLPRITDSYNTNSHFCQSVIVFVELLVLGYASEDLALGEQGRRRLDEDEYLLRRRVHRDLLAG